MRIHTTIGGIASDLCTLVGILPFRPPEGFKRSH